MAEIFTKDRTNIKRTLKPLNFPKAVVVETTAYCNLDCLMCPQATMKRPRGNMSIELFKKIADEVALQGNKTKLWVAIMGEPLTTGQTILDMIKYAKDIGVRSVNLNTNALLMTPTISRNLIDTGLDYILIGIDANTEATYNKIRRKGSFNLAVTNTLNLLKLKKESNSSKPKVIIQYIVMKENEEEVKDFKKFWLSKGAIVKLRPRLGWGTGVSAENLNLEERERTYPCPWLTRTVSIRWDGNFNQCDGDWAGLYSPGDFNKQSIKEVWEGELANRRDKHWKGDFTHTLCKECKDWQVAKAKFYYPKRLEN